MLAFAQNIPGGRLDFLDETVEINRSLMKKGLEMGYGKAAAYLEAADSAAARAQLAVGAASWARMAGVPLPGRNGNRLRESGHNIVAYNRRRGSFF